MQNYTQQQAQGGITSAIQAASGTTITPDGRNVIDVASLTATTTIAAPPSTMQFGANTILFRFINVNGQTISWTTGAAGNYIFGTDLPASVITGKGEALFRWYATDSRWRLVAWVGGF
jgi:hypothetical protein